MLVLSYWFLFACFYCRGAYCTFDCCLLFCSLYLIFAYFVLYLNDCLVFTVLVVFNSRLHVFMCTQVITIICVLDYFLMIRESVLGVDFGFLYCFIFCIWIYLCSGLGLGWCFVILFGGVVCALRPVGGLLLWLIGWFLVVDFCLSDLVLLLGVLCYLVSLMLCLDSNGDAVCICVVIWVVTCYVLFFVGLYCFDLVTIWCFLCLLCFVGLLLGDFITCVLISELL